MDSVEALRFHFKLGSAKTFTDLDQFFNDDKFSIQLTEFLHSKIGKIWLKSDKSKLYRDWQRSG